MKMLNVICTRKNILEILDFAGLKVEVVGESRLGGFRFWVCVRKIKNRFST